MDRFDALEAKIGYKFKDRALLTEAMTHSSYSHEYRGDGKMPCNERLEFLGDSVLSLVTSEYLFSRYADSPEGDLTRMRAELVRGDTALSCFAREIGIGPCLLLGNGEELGGGRDSKKILEDAFEALLAAVYLDAGRGSSGIDTVRAYLLPLIDTKLESISAGRTPVVDYKTQLQEVVQRNSRGERLEYIVVDEQGPAHAKMFTVEARVDSNMFGRGEGRTKRAAEQMAAMQALISLGEIPKTE